MNLLTLTFLFPLLGCLVLALGGDRLSLRGAATVGVTALGLAAASTVWVGLDFLAHGSAAQVMTLWTWIEVGDFQPAMGLLVDGLSLTMLGVITGVGFLIHLFAAWYMRGETGVRRFYAYMNLFVFSMVLLVLGDNLLLLYLGWEGVGLCSYLLIGYYYHDSANGWAAFKAFLVTRIGDVLMAIGLFILFVELGTLDIQTLLVRAPQVWARGDLMIELATLMLLGGALGKSAQLPLHTWLADAMAGPTPVSALIHAATMVTAGVYLIARMHGLFLLAPDVLTLVGWIGALTLLMAGFAALAQTDIKRVLAYSTMSQIGYMFLALGVGAFDAAIFHLMTHAFFKALLFLSAGSVIVSCHHEQDMRRLGGLWRKLPLAYAGFVVGGSALAALPLVTAGFYSKDEILWEALASGHIGLLLAGLVGALLTALYTVRLIIGTFHGQPGSEHSRHAEGGRGLVHGLPLVVLIVLSTLVGAWIHPPLDEVLPASPGATQEAGRHALEIVAMLVAVGGVAVALWLFAWRRERVARLVALPAGARLWRLWHHAWGFDAFYDVVLVKPFRGLVWLWRSDWINGLCNLVPLLARGLRWLLTRSQTGRLRHYAVSMTLGATVVLIFLAVG
ncbi:NADH dehydrogenase subunit L [Chromohalobacter marismortui]|uniref:NADH dehydrogenase subunit L n=1 Tax=Chromohalobacter marismortui TaxID=42055 RepID=A0A4R7NF77_9GAMM|nr:MULTISPECIES: NADH-quinone oxidoreductase subunit L [Chromohalobacter]MCI0510030.1 NADH-quinone oxidoreductase subunit L [Chromohalobacter sp.]MCI0593811.1 NADH-quinone oxidoreductase subunit L [Chromohalobacter sp.]TDU19002.1 NADH dehydrogenase subunit L [Chromohalobacter marismortui]